MDHTMDYGGYMPHGMCLLWEPWLVLLWAGSDLPIFLSYTAIPIALLRVLRQRTEVPHGGLVALFASFILLCGLTHALGIVTLWIPIYPWTGWVKLATGIVSMTTAVVLFRLIPDIIRLPSPASLAAVNQTLSDEIAAHKAILAFGLMRIVNDAPVDGFSDPGASQRLMQIGRRTGLNPASFGVLLLALTIVGCSSTPRPGSFSLTPRWGWATG